MLQITDHLFILGLNASASPTELKAAYRREISKWHPDRFQSDSANLFFSTERSKKINAAYEHLSKLHEIGSLPRSATHTTPRRTPQPQQSYDTQNTYHRKSYTPGFPDRGVVEVFVKSSHIVSAGYKRSSMTLYIKFGDNAVYSYLHVPETVYAAFISAQSHGKFAHRQIYFQYPSIRH